MTCYHPIDCAKGVDLATGKVGIYFKPDPPKGVKYIEPLQVPCGKCIGCRLDHSRMWATRCVHEAKMHDKNCFLTLTYNNEHLPENHSLVKRDMQLFWKRLRKEIGSQIRYFQCGEYGSKLNRPHYHAIVFGFDFGDKYLFSLNNNQPLYRSPTLERLWPYGFTTIGNVTFESCAYVARYCLKKVGGDKKAEHYGDKEPEYVCMSRRPGIGTAWLKKYLTDVYPADVCMTRLGTKGHIMPLRPSRFYDSIFDTIDPDAMASVKARRKEFSIQHNSRSEESLRASEFLKQSQVSQLIRPFEEIKNE